MEDVKTVGKNRTTDLTRDSSRNFLGAEAVAVDLVNSDLVADDSLGGIQ